MNILLSSALGSAWRKERNLKKMSKHLQGLKSLVTNSVKVFFISLDFGEKYLHVCTYEFVLFV